MTMPASDIDFDDVEALTVRDREGMLRSAAMAGAQARAVATAVGEGALSRLADMRPRSVVFLTGRGVAGRAAEILIATQSGRVSAPLVQVAVAPQWIGPLDLVLVSGEDAGDPALVQSTAQAVRHGAEVVVTGPDEGPLRAAGAGRAASLAPRLSVREPNRLMHHLAAMLAALRASGVERGEASGGALAELADALDGEALRNHPARESFHNPAKTLAARMREHRVVLSGDDAGAVAFARHAAAALLRAGGQVCAAAELADVLAMDRSRTAHDIFHDPDLDPPASAPLRVFVAASAATQHVVESRMRAIDGAELLLAGDEPDGVAGTRSHPPDAPPAADLDDRTELEQYAVLATRLEMTAAYLHLAGAR